MANLRGKNVFMTGATSPFGVETAVALAQAGANLALSARNADRLNAVAKRVTDLGVQAVVCPADVCKPMEIERAVNLGRSSTGRIDVLVNAAGFKCEGPAIDAPIEDVQTSLEVNYLSAVRFTQAVLPEMIQRGSGQILNVSSVLGKRATPQRAAYSASKAALNAWTDALRVELAHTGVAVTLICPGRLEDQSEAKKTRFAMGTRGAAAAVVRCIRRPRREVVLTPAGRMLCWLDFLAPALLDSLLARVRKNESLINQHPDPSR